MGNAFDITENNSQLYIYNEHSWQIYKDSYQSRCSKRILKKSFELIESMLARYSRVVMVRIDLKPSNYNADNTQIKRFLHSLRIALTEQYQSTVGYLCAREQNTSSKEHYHLAVFISGHKLQHPAALQRKISERWQRETQGSHFLVEHPYYTLRRGDKESIHPAIYRLSYLAKSETKQLNPQATSYLCSGIMPEKQRRASIELPYLLLVDEQQRQARITEAKTISVKPNIYTYKDKVVLPHKNAPIKSSTCRWPIAEHEQPSLSSQYQLSLQRRMFHSVVYDENVNRLVKIENSPMISEGWMSIPKLKHHNEPIDS